MDDTLVTCKQCGKPLPKKRFRIRGASKEGKIWRSGICKKCTYENTAEYKIRKHGCDPTARTRTRRYLDRIKTARQNDVRGPVVAQQICHNAKKADKRRGQSYGLTRPQVEDLISGPCHYCGETDLKMTLDRIDNSIGHVENNVLPACIRCNNIRGDMPERAWSFLVPKLKEAREAGLFDNWNAYWQRARVTP